MHAPGKKNLNWISIESMLPLSALLVAIVLVFYPALYGPLLLDDAGSVTTSKISELSAAEIKRVATSNSSGIFGRPIPVITFALNIHFWPENDFVLKLTNLLIHMVNTVLVFFLSKIIFSNILISKSHRQVTLLALTATSIWAIHPLQVSTIMYVVQRMTLLMTTFTLISVLSYIYFRKHTPATYKGLVLAASLVLISAILACLCKENGVLVFGYLFLLELTILQRSDNQFSKTSRFSALPIICCYTPILIGIVGSVLLFDRLTIGYMTRDFDLYQRLITQAGVVVMYFKMIALPNINDMFFYHDNHPIASTFNLKYSIYIGLITISAIIAILANRKMPLFTIGIGIFLISHIVESSFIPLELVFEHRNYLAILGIAVLAVTAISYMIQFTNSSIIKFIPGVAIVLVLATQTHSRSLEWSDGITLHNFALNANPTSVRARTSLAVELHNVQEFDKSVALLREGMEIHPEKTQIAGLLFHLLATTDRLTQKDIADVTNSLVKGQITKAIVFDLVNIHRSSKRGDITINPAILGSFFEIIIGREDKILAKQTEAMLLANYADHLAVNGERKIALKAIDMALNLDDSRDEYSVLKSLILTSLD